MKDLEEQKEILIYRNKEREEKQVEPPQRKKFVGVLIVISFLYHLFLCFYFLYICYQQYS